MDNSSSEGEAVETGIEVWLREPEPSIMLVLGPSGVGKTKSVENSVQQFPLQRHTKQCQYAIGTVPEGETRLSLPRLILERLGEVPRGHSLPELIEQEDDK